MNSKTKIINLYGGPGVGKSTIAAGLFYNFKKYNISCELISEYAKELVWENSKELLSNQILIFAEQTRRQLRLQNKVDFVITDSPLLLSSIYFDLNSKTGANQFFDDDFKRLAVEFFLKTWRQFNNLDYFISRSTKYDTSGRTETEEEAKTIDNLIIDQLKKHNPKFQTISSYPELDIERITEMALSDSAIEDIIEMVLPNNV